MKLLSLWNCFGLCEPREDELKRHYEPKAKQSCYYTFTEH